MKKTITIELVSDFDEDLLERILRAISDLLHTGKPQGIGNRDINMMVHREGAITTGIGNRDWRALAGTWKVE
jgi:hypothetical protein